MASGRTGTEIISDALKLLGNETLTSEGQVWLNNILDRLYEDYRWPFQEETATGAVAAGSTSIALPSDFADFWDRHGLRLVDDDGNQFSLIPVSADEFDGLIDPDLSGQPENAYVDLADLVWRPYPVPEQAYTYRLRYKKKPARITNFALTVTFPNDMLLTQAVFVRGLQHEDDDRYVGEAQILEGMIKNFLKGKNVSPLKVGKVRFLSPTFRNISALR